MIKRHVFRLVMAPLAAIGLALSAAGVRAQSLPAGMSFTDGMHDNLGFARASRVAAMPELPDGHAWQERFSFSSRAFPVDHLTRDDAGVGMHMGLGARNLHIAFDAQALSLSLRSLHQGAVGQAPAVASVAAVPEPQTYALMLAGLAAMVFASRRRASAAGSSGS